ncbi:MAG: hypothetical protein V4737_11865, partial [Curtobacterium sp.]
MKPPIAHDDAAITLTRTWSATVGWYLRSKPGLALFFIVAVIAAAGIVAAFWPRLAAWTSSTAEGIAVSIVGSPTPTPAASPTTDVKPILAAQRVLSDEIDAAERAARAAEPHPALRDHREHVLAALAHARAVRDNSTAADGLRREAQHLHRAVGGLATKAKAAAEAKVKRGREERAAEAAR